MSYTPYKRKTKHSIPLSRKATRSQQTFLTAEEHIFVNDTALVKRAIDNEPNAYFLLLPEARQKFPLYTIWTLDSAIAHHQRPLAMTIYQSLTQQQQLVNSYNIAAAVVKAFYPCYLVVPRALTARNWTLFDLAVDCFCDKHAPSCQFLEFALTKLDRFVLACFTYFWQNVPSNFSPRNPTRAQERVHFFSQLERVGEPILTADDARLWIEAYGELGYIMLPPTLKRETPELLNYFLRVCNQQDHPELY